MATQFSILGASLIVQKVKNLTEIQEIQIPSLAQEDSPGEGNGNPLQYSCQENPMDGGTWLGYCLWGLKESDMTERLN